MIDEQPSWVQILEILGLIATWILIVIGLVWVIKILASKTPEQR